MEPGHNGHFRIYHRQMLAQSVIIQGCEDCACPVSASPSNCSTPTHLQKYFLVDNPLRTPLEAIAIESLPASHSAIFDPQGRGDLAVLNPPARQLYDFFSRPQRPSALAQYFSDHSETELRESTSLLLQLGLLLENGSLPSQQEEPSERLTVWLHVTDACNMACSYCYLKKSGSAMDEVTGHTAVAAAFRSAVAGSFKIVKLKYAGGEATLNFPLVLKLHDYATGLAEEHGLTLEAVILSNGAAFTPERIDAIKQRGVRVMISLDGIAEHHDSQRPFVSGRGSFRAVDTGIQRLLAAEHPPHLSITITDRNVGGVAEVVKYALERELTFSLNFYRENECSASIADLRYSEERMIDGVLNAFRVIEDSLPPWSLLGAILDRGQLLQPRQRPCGVGQDYLVINHRGGIAKCHMEIENTVTSVQAKNPLAVIRANLDGAQNPAVHEKEGCRDCRWQNWCSGGCPVATFNATGRYDVKSPNCNVYKAIYPAALRLEALRLLKYCAPQVIAQHRHDQQDACFGRREKIHGLRS